MAILFFAENSKKPQLKYRIITKWLKEIIRANNKKLGNISYIFCDNKYLLGINKEYLKHDYYTDIITFDYVEGNTLGGDIFISCEMVYENSEKFGVDLVDEYLRVISHGILHLMGYEDGTDEEITIMRGKEAECISLYKKIENGFINI
jgi:rRNA maturation RNase YbeY